MQPYTITTTSPPANQGSDGYILCEKRYLYEPQVLKPIVERGAIFYSEYYQHTRDYLVEELSKRPCRKATIIDKIFKIKIPLIDEKRARQDLELLMDNTREDGYKISQLYSLLEKRNFYITTYYQCQSCQKYIALTDTELCYVDDMAVEEKESTNYINHLCQKRIRNIDSKNDLYSLEKKLSIQGIDKVQIMIRMCKKTNKQYMHVPKSIMGLIKDE